MASEVPHAPLGKSDAFWRGIEERNSRDGASLEESNLEHGMLAEPPFVSKEDRDQDNAEDDASDNASVGPLLGDSAPLHV